MSDLKKELLRDESIHKAIQDGWDEAKQREAVEINVVRSSRSTVPSDMPPLGTQAWLEWNKLHSQG